MDYLFGQIENFDVSLFDKAQFKLLKKLIAVCIDNPEYLQVEIDGKMIISVDWFENVEGKVERTSYFMESYSTEDSTST